MALISRRSPHPHYTVFRHYKPDLREDFEYCCAYCCIHESEWGGLRHFHVEHYRPSSKFPEMETLYSNLMYACDVCNCFKGADWPSDDPIDSGVGYLDPCEHDYDDHFSNDAVSGFVQGTTPPARYMVERLHLNRPFLTGLRARRVEQERIYQRIRVLCEHCLAQIDERLRDPSLAPEDRNSYETIYPVIQLFWSREVQHWKARWQPLYEPDDLR